MSKKTKSYELDLLERLKDPSYAAGYLNCALEDSTPGFEERFLIALKDVCVAHGITQLSSRSKLNRQNFYKAFSPKGNPEFGTLTKVLHSMGLKLAVQKMKKAS